MDTPAPLQRFVREVTSLVEAGLDERAVHEGARNAMRELVATDDWLPEDVTRPHPQYYQQYLLYAEPRGRFSVVSFVWGPGQQTPVHDLSLIHISEPRSMPITPQTVWSCTGVFWPGPHTKLTTEKRSSGSA